MTHYDSFDGYVLITGGAGFIGTNLAHRLLTEGQNVVLMDTLARPGAERNVRWLRSKHGERVRLENEDCRNGSRLLALVRRASHVFHFAAQVTVTASLLDPIEDFEINARGTLTLLEALRRVERPPPLFHASTNKVYGPLHDLELVANELRYEPLNPLVRLRGIGELRPLDFHSPQACSKGAADQYVLDYARSFGLTALVFRMSCTYGPHQLGTEHQGWVAHVITRALGGEPMTIFGDGRQVRDVLYVDDLVDAFMLARDHVQELSGRAFNIGGGPEHTVSLLELLSLVEKLVGQKPRIDFEAPRVGDQRYYVSDIESYKALTGWAPRVPLPIGAERLCAWLRSSSVPQVRGEIAAQP